MSYKKELKDFFGFDFEEGENLLHSIDSPEQLQLIVANKDKIVERAQKRIKIIIESDKVLYKKKGTLWEFKKDCKEGKAFGVDILKTFIYRGSLIDPIWGIINGQITFSKGSKIRKISAYGKIFLGEDTTILDSTITAEYNKNRLSAFTYVAKGVQMWSTCVINRSFVGPKSSFERDRIHDATFGKACTFGGAGIATNLTQANNIKILDPVTQKTYLLQTNKLGAIVGDNVTYNGRPYALPGLLIGKNSNLVISDPLTGCVRPNSKIIRIFVSDINGQLIAKEKSLIQK